MGALQYTTTTRLEITYSVTKVFQFMQALLETHWQVVKHILRYLAGTLDAALLMKPNPSTPMALKGFCDIDWASDLDEPKFHLRVFCISGVELDLLAI